MDKLTKFSLCILMTLELVAIVIMLFLLFDFDLELVVNCGVQFRQELFFVILLIFFYVFNYLNN